MATVIDASVMGAQLLPDEAPGPVTVPARMLANWSHRTFL